jgi:hypothetical protein
LRYFIEQQSDFVTNFVNFLRRQDVQIGNTQQMGVAMRLAADRNKAVNYVLNMGILKIFALHNFFAEIRVANQGSTKIEPAPGSALPSVGGIVSDLLHPNQFGKKQAFDGLFAYFFPAACTGTPPAVLARKWGCQFLYLYLKINISFDQICHGMVERFHRMYIRQYQQRQKAGQPSSTRYLSRCSTVQRWVKSSLQHTVAGGGISQ